MDKKNPLLSVTMILFCVAVTLSQQRLKIGPTFCSMEIVGAGEETVVVASPEASIQLLIKKILIAAGLPQNFSVHVYDRFNAEASYDRSARTRYIFYNRDFLASVKDKSQSEWGITGIMAHEIAHHLLGHTVERDTTNRDLELAADRYAGFVMCKMGATVEQAKAGLAAVSADVVTPSSKHPGRSERTKKVEEGWLAAGCAVTIGISVNPRFRSSFLAAIEAIASSKNQGFQALMSDKDEYLSTRSIVTLTGSDYCTVWKDSKDNLKGHQVMCYYDNQSKQEKILKYHQIVAIIKSSDQWTIAEDNSDKFKSLTATNGLTSLVVEFNLDDLWVTIK